MSISPMMSHYLEIKEKNKDAILFYRLGDFYEMFFEDAEIVSKTLGLTLTGKNCGLEERAPMCGIPHHSCSTYISRLLEKGFKVAICEQLSEPEPGKIVDRDIVRIITPGTVMEEDILSSNNNFLMSVFYNDETKIGISWLDISTGEFFMTTFVGPDALSKLNDLLVSVKPSEIISNSTAFLKSDEIPAVKTGMVPKFYQYLDFCYEFKNASQSLLNQLKIGSLAVIDCQNKTEGVQASGALLEYVAQTQKRKLDHINKLTIQKDNTYLYLDATAKLNLELSETIFERKQKGSLFWVLNQTQTSMGKRMLSAWLDKPLRDEELINERLDSVEELVKDNLNRDCLSEILSTIADIERICGRVSYGSVGPRGCFEMGKSLQKLPDIKKILDKFSSPLLKRCSKYLDEFSQLYNLLSNAFVEEDPKNPLPITAKDGNFIKSGFNKELDEFRSAVKNGRTWIANLESKERELTDIKNLKIKFNNLIGYFFEVPTNQIEKVPFRFERRQSLATAERFTSQELIKLAETVVGAEANALELELKIFDSIKEEMKKSIEKLQKVSQNIATVDVLISFAKTSITNKYVKPQINSKIDHISIFEGRHPVVEKIIKNQRFVPNNTSLDDVCHTMIITGPNMSGKSTYMRQVALITIMAHMGCFVPATSAEIAICDRIFTRIGATDNLGMGQSTFMVEMIEVANVINNATNKSLLILDEIGRGTSTYDGLSIAWAVLEYITQKIKAFTLFATHYHEITELEGSLIGAKNFQVAVKEFDNTIIFLHNILPGSANRSFGVEVATLAGINKEVVDRAKEVLHFHEELDMNTKNFIFDSRVSQPVSENQNKNEEVIKKLKQIEPNILTPLEAISKLAELKDMLKE